MGYAGKVEPPRSNVQRAGKDHQCKDHNEFKADFGVNTVDGDMDQALSRLCHAKHGEPGFRLAAGCKGPLVKRERHLATDRAFCAATTVSQGPCASGGHTFFLPETTRGGDIPLTDGSGSVQGVLDDDLDLSWLYWTKI